MLEPLLPRLSTHPPPGSSGTRCRRRLSTGRRHSLQQPQAVVQPQLHCHLPLPCVAYGGAAPASLLPLPIASAQSRRWQFTLWSRRLECPTRSCAPRPSSQYRPARRWRRSAPLERPTVRACLRRPGAARLPLYPFRALLWWRDTVASWALEVTLPTDPPSRLPLARQATRQSRRAVLWPLACPSTTLRWTSARSWPFQKPTGRLPSRSSAPSRTWKRRRCFRRATAWKSTSSRCRTTGACVRWRSS